MKLYSLWLLRTLGVLEQEHKSSPLQDRGLPWGSWNRNTKAPLYRIEDYLGDLEQGHKSSPLQDQGYWITFSNTFSNTNSWLRSASLYSTCFSPLQGLKR